VHIRAGCSSGHFELGVGIANGWVLQNPVFNGYEGIAAYLSSQTLSIVIDNTHGPNANAGTSIATDIFKALAAHLAPDNPIEGTVCVSA
jgi:D-alanyl-D-alanine carboxypeptidase